MAVPPNQAEDRFAEALERLDRDLRAGRGLSPSEALQAESEFGDRLEGAKEVLDLLHAHYRDDARPASSNLPVGIPQRLWHYELIRMLGGGGMGVVMEARHSALKRLVALKVMKGLHAPNPSDRRQLPFPLSGN